MSFTGHIKVKKKNFSYVFSEAEGGFNLYGGSSRQVYILGIARTFNTYNIASLITAPHFWPFSFYSETPRAISRRRSSLGFCAADSRYFTVRESLSVFSSCLFCSLLSEMFIVKKKENLRVLLLQSDRFKMISKLFCSESYASAI